MTQTNPKALQRIQEAKEKKLKKLDLSLCSLTEIPEEVYEMDWIEELVLSHPEYYYQRYNKLNKLSNLTSRINSIKSLRFIHAYGLSKLKIDSGIRPLLSLQWSVWQKNKNILSKDQVFGLRSNEKKEFKELELTLDQFPKLSLLNLYGNQISDISVLQSLTNLNSLSLSDNQISDISVLQSLTNLNSLSLSYNQISDFSVLQSLTNLNSLNLSDNQISDISVLQSLTNLNTLNLSDNQISDISVLQSLTNLNSLSLSYNQISDISVLQSLTNLNSLFLSDNQISDISVLQSLTNLNSLNLSDNQISDFSVLQSLTNLNSLSLSDNQISDISVLQSLTNLNSLNLSYNQISDISVLQSLTNLNTLYLSSNQISDFSVLQSLTNLNSLSLSDNQISDISVLQSLTNLNSLSLSSNQISDISVLQSLTNLNSLSLGSNQISDISVLKSLTNLNSLSLSYNQISDFSVLQSLTNLNSLYLSSNQISDFSVLQSLTNLNTLFLSDNQISDISVLKSLTNLNSLFLSDNQISDISVLQSLTNLNTLYLNNNQISDISVLQSLTNLNSLNLSYNKINDVSVLQSLANLNTLNLSDNQLEKFPKNLLRLPFIRYLSLNKNPIQDFPFEIINQRECFKDATSWINDLSQDSIPNTELKMILLGNGRVGKTCIIKRLVDNTYNDQEKSTHAIQIKNWKQKLKVRNLKNKIKLKSSTIRIWDFGGQDIYHATHRFFMQSRALFLLAWDWKTAHEPNTPEPSEEGQGVSYENFPLPHWLDYINSLGKRSPVLIVQNKVDRDLSKPVPDQDIVNACYSKIENYLSFSAATGEGKEPLEAAIRYSFEKMPELGMLMPRSWYEVRKEVLKRINKLQKKKSSKKEKRYLEYSEFQKICQEKRVNFQSLSSLLRYLHNTGIVFFQENLFKNRIILDQSWAIRAIYSLFDRDTIYFELLEAKNGQFNMKTLGKIWNKHSNEEQKLFLSFMKSCELCFQINKDNDNPVFIAPQLLPKEKPILLEGNWKDKTDPVFHFVYQHRFLHRAIIHRFIVRAGHLANTQKIWYNGIHFQYADTQASIEVTKMEPNLLGEEGQKKIEVIYIRVSGRKSQDLLSLIRKEFKKIHPDIIQPQAFISRNGNDFIRYKDFIQYKKTGLVQMASLNHKSIDLADLDNFVLVEKPFKEVQKPLSRLIDKNLEELEHEESPDLGREKETTFQDLIPDADLSEEILEEQFLFIGDVAKNEKRLWHPEEINVIKRNFKEGESSIHWIKEEGVTFNKFQEILVRGRHQYLYFAGHSSKEGIHLLDKQGHKKVIKHMDVFKHTKKTLKCAIFCSCDSDEFAPNVGQYIDYVIAMKAKIRDQFAENFSGGFSLGLSAGRSIKESFEMGLERIRHHHEDEIEVPVLYIKGKPYSPNN